MQFIGRSLIVVSIVWGVYIAYSYMRIVNTINAMNQFGDVGRIAAGRINDEFSSQILIPIILFIIGIALNHIGSEIEGNENPQKTEKKNTKK